MINEDKVDKDIVAKKLVIGPEDAEVVIKFFENFELEMPDYLKQSLEDFKSNPTIATQKRFVIDVNKAISTECSLDGIDDMFKPVVECAKEAAYNLEFDEELENVLTETEDQKGPSSETEEP